MSNYELNYLNEQIWTKFIFVYCNLLLYVHPFNFFPYPSVFLRLYIHIHLNLRFALIITIIILCNIFFIYT